MTNEEFKKLYPTEEEEENYYVRKVMDCFSYFEIDEGYSDAGVRRNVETWLRNSKKKFEMLRKHPNWNEEAKAVVFLADEEREIDEDKYFSANIELECFIEEMIEFPWTSTNAQKNIMSCLRTCIEIEKLITDESASVLNSRFDLDVKAGTKLSRFIQKVYKNYEVYNLETGEVKTIDATSFKRENEILVTVGDHKETRIKTTSFNSLFAILADTINPIKIKRITVFSANILDFLTMSNGNSWASCHYINSHGLYHGGQSHYSGCYKAGTLSYALDENSYILYTLPKEYEGDSWWKEQKITRTIFAYNDDVLLQSRLYPQDNDGTSSSKKTEYRNLVQKIISDCEEKPNFWNAPISDIDEIREYVKTGYGALNYEDYFYSEYSPKISVRKLDFSKSHERMIVGHVPYCVDCGSEITESEHLCCGYCYEEKQTCACCGDAYSEDDMYWDGNREAWYCSDCVHYCEYHDRYEYCEDCNNDTNNRGYVCDRTVGYGHYVQCRDCGLYFPEDEGYYCQDDEWRCDSCANDWEYENTKPCYDCGNGYLIDDLIEGEDGEHRCHFCNHKYLNSSESENETGNSELEEPSDDRYNGKVRLVSYLGRNLNNYTLGKIYKFTNGSIVTDQGVVINNAGDGFKDFEAWQEYSSSRWEEVEA